MYQQFARGIQKMLFVVLKLLKNVMNMWGCNSVARMSALQAERREFESPQFQFRKFYTSTRYGMDTNSFEFAKQNNNKEELFNYGIHLLDY